MQHSASAAVEQSNLLEIRNLSTYFHTEEGIIRAVDDVTLNIKSGSTLGIVGESGCGKSVTAHSILRLVPQPPAKITGSILFRLHGRTIDLNQIHPRSREIRRIRGKEISMIFQEPMTSLNPVFTVGNQLMEAILLHQEMTKQEARDLAVEMLHKVGIPVPDRRVEEYPHQLSGGMRQRVMIAMALACNPQLLIADEPTTALDVTIQAQILDLMRALQNEMGTSIMMITHDLGVIAEVAEDVVVMYLGQIVEEGTVRDIFARPEHPYTKGLLQSIPRFQSIRDRRLVPIVGMVPESGMVPTGCRFGPRCQMKGSKCRDGEPPNVNTTADHRVKCWLCD